MQASDKGSPSKKFSAKNWRRQMPLPRPSKPRGIDDPPQRGRSRMQTGQATSYAEANSMMEIAVLSRNYPEETLSADQLIALEDAIVQKMMKMILGAECRLRFGDIHFRFSMLLVDYVNQETADWLRAKVPSLGTWGSLELMMCLGDDIPRAHTITVFFSKRELRSWWSPNSLVNYDEKLQCLSNQYSDFLVPEMRGRKLHPGKTQDEDMADLAGMKISYDTYINWNEQNGPETLLPGLNYSANQLFWISAATRHCAKYSEDSLKEYIDRNQWSLEKFRVNGPLQNLKEFAFDFGCAKGSKMNPENKCDIW
ncbi:unnamed protein product [Phaedon cochleariae]|uniref:Peptidase M13 C-terminal domain-containing protein n=1 Tax=Phaedon cochleariae TaxID=80249 RepID=A0A9N9SEX7_PHACE|nr:unnamed protein product [Phaedon cochleariae]